VQGVPPLGGIKQWWGGENKLFVAKCVNISKSTMSSPKLLMNDSKLYMRFRLTPRSMTLDDLELYKFEFSENFSGFRRFRTQQQLNEWSRPVLSATINVVSTSNWSNFWHVFASRGFVSNSWAWLLILYKAWFCSKMHENENMDKLN